MNIPFKTITNLTEAEITMYSNLLNNQIWVEMQYRGKCMCSQIPESLQTMQKTLTFVFFTTQEVALVGHSDERRCEPVSSSTCFIALRVWLCFFFREFNCVAIF